jgi:hypothetical protein
MKKASAYENKGESEAKKCYRRRRRFIAAISIKNRHDGDKNENGNIIENDGIRRENYNVAWLVGRNSAA